MLGKKYEDAILNKMEGHERCTALMLLTQCKKSVKNFTEEGFYYSLNGLYNDGFIEEVTIGSTVFYQSH